MPPAGRDNLSRMSGRRLGIVGAVSFVVFLIALFPAGLAWQWQEHRVPLVSLATLEGTVWDGTARGVVVAGVPLGTASVSFRPLALLRGEWRNHIRVDAPQGKATGNSGWTITGARVASDVSLRTSLAQILRYYPGGSHSLSLPVDGKVALVIDELVVRNGGVDRLEGSLQLSDATVGLNAVGALVADLRARDGGLVADFHSAGDRSPGIEGTAFWRPAGDYRLTLGVAEPDLLGKELGGLVRGFARQDNGKWRVDWQGRF